MSLPNDQKTNDLVIEICVFDNSAGKLRQRRISSSLEYINTTYESH